MGKISALPEHAATPAAGDLFPFLDVSSGTTETVRYDNLAIGGGSTDAADINIVDTATLFEATEVEAALAELADGSILDNRYVQSSTALSVVVLTQAQYDALTPVSTTLYVVIG